MSIATAAGCWRDHGERGRRRAALRASTCGRVGSSPKGIRTGRVRSGYRQYFMGTSPPYLATSAAYRLFERPVPYGSTAIVWGHFWSLVRCVKCYEGLAFRRFPRRYQRECLPGGKGEATRRLNAEKRRPSHPSRSPEEAASEPNGGCP